ncbi:MAG: hypothetical protein NZ936_10480 [Alphaproteobacteria bacterium]|nr:hypothetical protein [Alphaproteobacteria bacterium]
MGLSDKIVDNIAEEAPLLLGAPEFTLDLWWAQTGKVDEATVHGLDTFREWWGSVRSS